jgi:hypothetical protein
MRAVFNPKNLTTLRPHMVSLIGYEAEWDYSGEMEHGPYAGQSIYHMSRNDPRYAETQAVWLPAEDLEVCGNERLTRPNKKAT